jgi:biopolymer transport protein ExbD
MVEEAPMTQAMTRPSSEINVTPLVDVCLVLLIIFIVVSPATQLGYDARLPLAREKPLPAPAALVVSLKMIWGRSSIQIWGRSSIHVFRGLEV